MLTIQGLRPGLHPGRALGRPAAVWGLIVEGCLGAVIPPSPVPEALEDGRRMASEELDVVPQGLSEQRQEPEHRIVAPDGALFDGSWEEIVRRMRDEKGDPSHSLQEFMSDVARYGLRQSGVQIPTHDAESFIRGSAVAGLLRIVR